MGHQYVNPQAKEKLERYSMLCVKAILTEDETKERKELGKELLQSLMAVNTAKGFKIKYTSLIQVKDENVSPDMLSAHSAWLGTYEVITKILGEDP